jgi:hypothetical protein
LGKTQKRNIVDYGSEPSALRPDSNQAASQPPSAAKPCLWTADDDDSMPNTYFSACGEAWAFVDGGVKENNVRFCHGCGNPVGLIPPG